MISTPQSQSDRVSYQLEQLRRRFDAWREICKPKTPIPNRLWNSAVKVAMQCGLGRTAKALRLNYYALKKRIDAYAIDQPSTPAFIELTAAPTESVQECSIELENRCGDKMRIQIKGMNAFDLNALSSAFWRDKP
jgi:hypothetical protein